MPTTKLSYVAHIPGHKNSKGEAAPWVIKDHKDDHTISSHKTEGEAKSHLQDMHAHSASKTATISRDSLDDFTRAYIEAALWSSTDDEGNPLDRYDIEDLSPATLEAMVQDCKQFQQQNAAIMTGCNRRGGGYSEEIQAGHDFWLTRNGRGAGFWDGDWPENGKALTLAAKKYGEADLYVGDDGYIYQLGKEDSTPIPPRESFDELTDTEGGKNWMEALRIRGSLKKRDIEAIGLTAHFKSQLLYKKAPKLATQFESNERRHYDYEANGNDVVLISPANTSKLLQGDEAKTFWVALDQIENETVDATQQEHQTRVQSLIRSYFDAEVKKASKKYIIQVDASRLKKATITFLSGVGYKEGKIDRLKFTSKRSKAKVFSQMDATKVVSKLPDFKLTGSIKEE